VRILQGIQTAEHLNIWLFTKNVFKTSLKPATNLYPLGMVHHVKSDYGIVHIKLNINGIWRDGKLEDVLHILSLNKNLFSVGACVKKGYTVIFEQDIVKISLNNALKAAGIKKKNNLFQMLFRTVPKNENCAAVVLNLELWHKLLGHVSCKTAWDGQARTNRAKQSPWRYWFHLWGLSVWKTT